MNGGGRWLIAALGGALVIGLLVVLVSELQTSREHIESQDAKASLQLQVLSELSERSEPVLESSRKALAPLADDPRRLRRTLSAVPSLSTAVINAVNSATPVLDELGSSEAFRSLEAIGPTLDEARPVLEQANSAEARELADRSRRALDALELRSLRRALDRGGQLSRQALGADLVKRLRRTTGHIEAVLEVQRATRKLQRASLGVQRESLTIQKETLDHAKSLDRKLGGETVP